MIIEAKLLHLQAIKNLLAPYRYLYCVDLEATCDEVEGSEKLRPLAVPPDQMETIEIGLVVIDLESLEIVDEFDRVDDMQALARQLMDRRMHRLGATLEEDTAVVDERKP